MPSSEQAELDTNLHQESREDELVGLLTFHHQNFGMWLKKV